MKRLLKFRDSRKQKYSVQRQNELSPIKHISRQRRNELDVIYATAYVKYFKEQDENLS